MKAFSNLRSRQSVNIILFACLMLLFACDREEVEEQTGFQGEERLEAAPYAGRYRVEPTDGKILLLHRDGTAELLDPSGKRISTGRFRSGSRSLRIYLGDAEGPTAVFLLENRERTGWRGRWGDDIKILYLSEGMKY